MVTSKKSSRFKKIVRKKKEERWEEKGRNGEEKGRNSIVNQNHLYIRSFLNKNGKKKEEMRKKIGRNMYFFDITENVGTANNITTVISVFFMLFPLKGYVYT